MKKIILAIAFFTSIVTFSQTAKWDAELPINATTQKEFNYLTKGLKIQIESGLDVIDGYSLLRGEKQKIGNYTFNAQYLFKKSDNLIKAVSVIINSSISGKTYYICIPYKNNDLVLQYWNSINVFDENLSRAYGYFMSELFIESKIFSASAFTK